MPRPPHRVPRVLLALAGMSVAAPAAAAGSPVQCMLWFTLGVVVAIALVMLVSSRVLRERVAPRSAWLPYAGAAVGVLAAGVLLAFWMPWLALALALPAAAWGLWLVDRMARRMRRLLDERDHARAEAKRAKQDSERDPLTGALNRGAWHQRLVQLTENHREDNGQAKPLSVLFFDIDLFKLINDSLGHGVGDDCLKAVSRTVGEEVVELTVSIGAAEYLGADEALESLIERADRAMYTAKDSGRNMVVADAATPTAAN
jgi:GGDEF domain-containing protein